jgi:hypothetical protein
MNKYSKPASPKFLEELRERASRYGWKGDFVEVARFVEELHQQSGVPLAESFFDPPHTEGWAKDCGVPY